MEIYTTFTLSQMQTVFSLILSAMGFGWFFFLSNIVKFRASNLLKNNAEVPILETIVPTTVTGVFEVVKTLRIKWTTLVVFTSIMVVLGLVLTSFEGIIVVNTVHYVESCSTAIVKTQGKILGDFQQTAPGASAEIEAMINKRNKSGVPSGILVGQIPEDNRWKYDANLDVEPYPWRSSCSLYKSGVTQVNMNTLILDKNSRIDLRKALPEVHADYIFHKSPYGYKLTNFVCTKYIYNNGTTVSSYVNGVLLFCIEEFRQRGSSKSYSKIGMKYTNRLWTLRVPETTRIPHNRNNKISEILSVPMVVKAYTCEMERVKEGDLGGYNILANGNNNFLDSVDVSTQLTGREWTLAVMGGKDTSIYELTPEHWASYLAVKDTQTAKVEEVFARINVSCITVHPAYISLVCAYLLMFIVGIYLVIIRRRAVPSSVIDWASHACKESRAGDNTKHGLLGHYNLEVTPDDALKIKSVKNSDVKNKDEV